jgi:hypothetical protein
MAREATRRRVAKQASHAAIRAEYVWTRAPLAWMGNEHMLSPIMATAPRLGQLWRARRLQHDQK